jgi:hypothetical protein
VAQAYPRDAYNMRWAEFMADDSHVEANRDRGSRMPVLDIKPHVPRFDCAPDATIPW